VPRFIPVRGLLRVIYQSRPRAGLDTIEKTLEKLQEGIFLLPLLHRKSPDPVFFQLEVSKSKINHTVRFSQVAIIPLL
jgi:hypothetical protein